MTPKDNQNDYMLPVLAPLWLESATQYKGRMEDAQKQLKGIKHRIETLRDTYQDEDCDNDDCPKNCDGKPSTSDTHPTPHWPDTVVSDYGDETGEELITCINEIADVVDVI